MVDITPVPENVAIKSELKLLLKAWRECWMHIGIVGQTVGPKGPIPERIKKFMRPDSIEAEEPEAQALNEIIDYCVTAILVGYDAGNYEEVLGEIIRTFSSFDRRAEILLGTNVQHEVFKRVLDGLNSDKKIDEVKRATRGRLGAEFTFGVLD
jgi:hypothetical protein